MGTRHIVEVIKDNKKVIRQYGQWDGYADTAAYHLRNFIKEHGAEYIRDLLEKTEIHNDTELDSFHWKESALGVNTSDVDAYIEKIKMLGSFRGDGIEDIHIAIIPAVVEKFGLEKAMQHYLMTRDTGYKILDVLGIFSCFEEIKYGNLKMPIYLEPVDMDTGRKIIINLDKETFTCRYFGKEQTWNFDKLPTLTELRKVDKW